MSQAFLILTIPFRREPIQEEAMLFDIVSAIEATASAALVTAVLSFTLSKTVHGRLRAALIIAVWFAGVVALGATEALDNQTGVGVPGLAIAIILPVAALCAAFFALQRVREAMTAIPLPVLIAVNILRVLGVSFILLYFAHRLAAPFAPVAGWGDVLVGITAGPIAWVAARKATRARELVLVWNIIGFLDLTLAVGLGATSSPGPIRLFMDPPGSAIMTTLPWIIIPCFLVPSLLSTHIAIFSRLGWNASAGRFAGRKQDRYEESPRDGRSRGGAGVSATRTL
jgi:hypothetical protein